MIVVHLIIYCLYIVHAQEELSLIGKKAKQSETWSDRVADLAIDGNETTFSVAASQGNTSVLGWWEVDLEGNYEIGQIIITASLEDYNAKYLQNFSILLLDANRTESICYQYSSAENFAPSETRSFPCQNYPFAARFIKISRDGGPFRPDGMSLAEVKVIIGKLIAQVVASIDNGKELSLIGKKAKQSETWSDRVADLAIDGNETTFSVAASQGNTSVLGWWEVDLEGDYEIGQIIITASLEDYNAKYLQNFSILLLDANRTESTCYQYSSAENFAPSETRSFLCQNYPFAARFIKISRDGGWFRPDGMSLAEVKVIIGKPIAQVLVSIDNSTISQTSRPSNNQLNELPLIGKKAKQSETWSDRVADLAIDGNVTTFSVAASPTNSSVLGWWEVDLEGNYFVGEVRITSSYEEYNAHYLQNFTILLMSENRTSSTCYNYLSQDSIPPNQTRSFRCLNGNFKTKFIRISRLGGPFRQDGMSLAEVQAFVSYNLSAPSPIYMPEVGGYEILLGGLKTHQSSTWGDHIPSLAIDGNINTFTISCISCNNTLATGVGWWQIDLGTERPITAISLTSSLDQYNSDYLQNIIVAITSWNTTDLANARICYTFNNSSTVPAGITLTFNCENQPTWGRFVFIKRMEDAPHRPDALAIAEFKAYESTPTQIPSAVLNDTSYNGTIPKSSIQTVQSSTFDNHLPSLALDENVNTFTSAIASSIISYWSPVAWWQADLGAFYNITQVDIISPNDDTYARHLESFSIDVYPKSIFEDPYLPGAIQCGYYPPGKFVLPGTTETFQCIAPNYGRYVIVRKVKDINSLPENLSFAEITFHRG